MALLITGNIGIDIPLARQDEDNARNLIDILLRQTQTKTGPEQSKIK
jgi:hypothetical protein